MKSLYEIIKKEQGRRKTLYSLLHGQEVRLITQECGLNANNAIEFCTTNSDLFSFIPPSPESANSFNIGSIVALVPALSMGNIFSFSQY